MYDLALLDKDTDKIVRACSSDAITAQLIEEILIGDSGRFVFRQVDALVAGYRGKALAISEAMIKEDDGSMAALALLTKQLRSCTMCWSSKRKGSVFRKRQRRQESMNSDSSVPLLPPGDKVKGV